MEPMEPGYPCEINKESIEFTNVKDFHHVIDSKLYMKLLNKINILQCLLNKKIELIFYPTFIYIDFNK